MDRFVLEILDGDRAGSVIPLWEDKLRIGRRSENDLVLSDEKVSGKHAEVAFEEGRYVLRDVGSTNGTLMDGRRVAEVALTDRDTFQIGRIRVSFHREGEAHEPDLQLHRLSAEGLQRAPRSSKWMVALISVLLLGGGALYYNLNVGPGPIRAAIESRPVSVPNNRLAQEVASFEGEQGWELQVAGDAFDYGPNAHTGARALQVRAGAGGAGFALARLQESVKVRGELILTGFLRTEGTARIGMRVRFSSSLEEELLEFTTGIEPTALTSGTYQKVEWAVAVPPTMDLAQVELLALLPEEGDAAFADDLAVLEAGTAVPIDERAGGRLIGAGSSMAVRLFAGDPVVLGVRPVVTDGPLLPVAAARLATLSDAGIDLEVESSEPSVTVRLEGGSGLVLDLPEGAVQSVLMRAGDDPFERVDGEDTADELLLGAGTARLLVELPSAVAVSAAPGESQLTLSGVDELQFRMSFQDERARAAEELESARESEASDPGAALRHLQTVVDYYPHETRQVREALEMKAAMVAARDQRIEELRASLDSSLFFRTRGGFVRVRDGLRQLVDDYGDQLDRVETVVAMQEEVEEAIAALDLESGAAHAARLTALAEVLGKSGQEDLAKMVRDYLKRK